MSAAVKIYKHFETPADPGTYHRLICLTGEEKGKAYFILGKRIIMGRSEQADVTIKDMKSSREHAEIINIGRNYVLTDLGSQNGVIVNDLKIKQHTLSDGDKIIIGKTVYKFSKVVIKESQSAIMKRKRDENLVDDFEENFDEPDNKRLNLTLVVVIVIGVLLLLTDGGGKQQKVKKEKLISRDIKELTGSDSFNKAIKERNKLSKKNEEKLSIYFQRGLREYREGNYFRAMEEFKSAQQWSPSDRRAQFYYRKTVEKLHEQIELYFSRAIRDTDAVKYNSAVVSYCNVVRLLIKNQDDERYKTAINAIRNLEEKMGLEEGEVKCVNVDGGAP